jgi:hypothetical protein
VGDASKAVARILSEVQHTEDAIQMERPPQMQFLLFWGGLKEVSHFL